MNRLSIRSYSLDIVGHEHDYHQVVMPIHGHQTLYINNRAIQVSYGDAAVITRHTFHQFHAEDNFRFLVMDADELPDNILSFPDIAFALNKNILSYLEFIDNQLSFMTDSQIERSIFDLLVQLLANLQWQNRIDNRLKKVLQHFNDDISTNHSIDSLSKIACMSQSHFKSLFKKEFNKTPMQYLTLLRMKKAMGLIKHTDMPIYMVSEQCGYKDVSAFNRRFLKEYKQTPKKFRKL